MQLLAIFFVVPPTIHAEPPPKAAYRSVVQHRNFEDFSRGTFPDSGSNLYATHSGTLEMIHRWDLNNDGHLDLFVGQDHNHVENVDALIYWGRTDGPQSILPDLLDQQPLDRMLRAVADGERHATRLPSDGGGRSLIVDLNADGYPEIVFCNYIHNYSVHMKALIYWGHASGYSATRRTELPTLMAQGLAAADFNQDGFLDLAFANSGIEGGGRFGYDQHLESYIYWNSPAGFDIEQRTSIPTVSAVDCAAGDITGDGYPELVFANSGSDEKSVSVYTGSKQGFSETHREIRPGGDPVGVTLADVSRDGTLDMIVMHRDSRAQVFRGAKSGFEREPWKQLTTDKANECRSDDLNRDAFPDIVFANSAGNESFIYWGNADGWDEQHRGTLPTMHATGVALADFNNDGWIDVGFSNERNDSTYDVNSYIYWNGPQGLHAANRRDLQGFGAVSIQASDLNADKQTDCVLINRISGTHGPVGSFIYWGNSQNKYSPAAMSVIRGTASGAVAIADLNQDNWLDIAYPGGLIFWGTPAGFDPQQSTEISGMDQGRSTSVADLNRDGFLDLVTPVGLGYGDNPRPVITILWGSAHGYHKEAKTELNLNSKTCYSVTIADLNKDGHLDLIAPDADTEILELFYGSPQGYGQNAYQALTIHSTSHVEVADLNGDRWLDLIMGGCYDPHQFGRPMRVLSLLWGGPAGYSLDRRTILDGYEAEEQAIVDINRDGFLDIATTNYHAYTTRSVPFYVYWGAADGKYSNERRSSLPTESSSALTLADLNKDDWPDAVVFNHIHRGDHGVGAHLYWGGPEGYSVTRREWLPTFGPHYGVRRDIGNIYNRKLEERYVSESLAWPPDQRVARLRWIASTPHGTAVRLQVRSAPTEDALTTAIWHGPDAKSTQWFEQSGTEFLVPQGHLRLQYQVGLATPNGGSTPVLDEISLDAKN